MIEKFEDEFAYKFHLGLRGRNFRDTILVYISNLIILLFVYMVSRAWGRLDDIFIDYLPILVLSLIGIEYVLTTYFIERSKRIDRSEVRNPNKLIRNELTRYLWSSTVVPCNLKIIFPALLFLIIFAGWYLQQLHLYNEQDIIPQKNGSVLISIDSDELKVKGSESLKNVWAIIKPQNQSLYYTTPVHQIGDTWRVLITNANFLNQDNFLQINYYIDPKGAMTPDKVVKQYPLVESSQTIIRYADIKMQRTTTDSPQQYE